MFQKTHYTHGYIGDMVLSKNGKRLYAVDQIGFRMLILITETNQLIASVPVGRYPFGIALSPDEKTTFVANVGMYKYSLIRKKHKGEWKNATLDFPAFSYESEGSERGIRYQCHSRD